MIFLLDDAKITEHKKWEEMKPDYNGFILVMSKFNKSPTRNKISFFLLKTK